MSYNVRYKSLFLGLLQDAEDAAARYYISYIYMIYVIYDIMPGTRIRFWACCKMRKTPRLDILYHICCMLHVICYISNNARYKNSFLSLLLDAEDAATQMRLGPK
jgi:hypothetical protein